jgi:cobalt/nickel transport system permease protein
MTLALEPLPCPDSPLRRLDPRWKLAGLLVAAAAAASVRTPPAAAGMLAGAVLLAVLGRLPRRWYLARLGALLGFLVVFVAFIPFVVRDDGPGFDLGPVRLSWHGVAVAGVLCMRAAALVTLVLVALATAPPADTLKAARALRLPGLLVQLAVLTYRYVFVLADELGRLRVALRVRGYRNRMTRHSYRTVGHVAGTLLVRGAERAERVGQAMRCRGFDGRFRSLTTFRTKAVDVAAFLAIGGGAAGLWMWDRLA